jgi:CspA family cold shock protein
MTAPGKVGTIKMYDQTRGFGFISCADGSEIYFHVTSIASNKPPEAGDRVKFIPGLSRRGRSLTRNVAVLQTVWQQDLARRDF